MKNYKMTDLLKKDVPTLQADILELTGQLIDFKVKNPLRKQSDDTSSHKKIRKQIARLNTAIKQLEGNAAKVKETK